jgi:hypothetical protein
MEHESPERGPGREIQNSATARQSAKLSEGKGNTYHTTLEWLKLEAPKNRRFVDSAAAVVQSPIDLSKLEHHGT